MTEHQQPETPETLTQALAAPFAADRVRWKAAVVAKETNRALAVAYIDARDVAERLDAVVGPFGWQVRHEAVGSNLLTGIAILNPATGEWIWKWDGGHVDDDERDPGKSIKGAYSDGMKRAAVLWGIGRYLYRLPRVWCDYDKQKRVILSDPVLPAWALPKGAADPAQTQRQNGAADRNGGRAWSQRQIDTLVEHVEVEPEEALAWLRLSPWADRRSPLPGGRIVIAWATQVRDEIAQGRTLEAAVNIATQDLSLHAEGRPSHDDPA